MQESSNKSPDPHKLEVITTYRSGVLQAKAHRLLNRKMAEFLRPYDITCMQWFIIGLVHDAGPAGIRLTDLMQQLDTTLPFITTNVNMLEAKGAVEKHAHATDNRTKMVSIRPLYRPTVKSIEEKLRQHLRQLLYANDAISREELQVYMRVLSKIVR